MRLQFLSSSIKDIDLYRNYVQRFIDERCRIEDTAEIWTYFMYMPKVGAAIAKSYAMSNQERITRIIRNISKPKLTVIAAGVKGGGKTAFCYFLAEKMHEMFGFKACLFNPLNFKPELLPDYFYDAYDESEIKPKSFIVYDEAAIFISSRRSMSTDNVDFSRFMFIQRHTGCPMITSQQILASTDINTLRMADNFVFKMIGLMQMEKERNRRDPMFTFLDFMRPLNIDEVLFMSADLTEIYLAKTPLPTFWTEELSVPAQRTNREDAVKMVNKFYERGMHIKRISQRMQILGWDWTEDECLEQIGIKPEKKKRRK